MYTNKKMFTSFITFLIMLICISQGYVYGQDNLIENSRSKLQQEYNNIQVSNISDEQKVYNAVNTYFLERLEASKNNKLDDWGYLFDNSHDGEKLLEYESNLINYILLGEKRNNSMITWYSFKPLYIDLEINGICAEVKVKGITDVKFSNSGEHIETIGSEVHSISLVKKNNIWKIVNDEYRNEMRDLYPPETDWNKLFNEYDKVMNEREYNNKKLWEKRKLESETDITLRQRFDPSFTYDQYLDAVKETKAGHLLVIDRDRFQWYGNYYTDDSYTNNTSSYNSLFKNFAPNDCQNFYNQALWYAFGGVNNASSINSHAFPMIDLDSSGTTDWWCDNSTTDSNYVWTYIPYFKNTIIDNSNNYKMGVAGIIGALDSL